MRVKNFKEKEIKEWLEKGTESVKIIHRELNIDSSTDHNKIYDCMLDDLKEMGYKIGYDNDENNNVLFNSKIWQSIPATTMSDKKTILLNENFPELAQYEALFHEYIHIKGSDNLQAIEDILENKKELHNLDNLVDITACILTMPPEEMKQNLLKNNYKINIVLTNNYAYFEKCSVLQWISIISHFACHFAWVMVMKDINKKIFYDNYYYDHQNNPQDYDIEGVLDIPRSAAAQAVKYEKYAVNKESFIGINEYQCYAYYEKGLNRVICNVELEKNTVQYDRLLVIGWKRSAYNTMKKTLKAQSK